jgi:CheY-like chemotaxis protein
MKVLIIDDSIDFSENSIFVEDISEKYDLKVTSIQSLKEAYNHLTNNSHRYKYDLILIDKKFDQQYHCEVPKITSGVDLIKNLADLKLPTPKILFTATGRDPDIIKLILGDYDCTYFFEKHEVDRENIFIPDKFWKLPGYVRIIIQRSNEITKHLKKYFQSISQEDAYLWQQEVAKGSDADWSKFEAVLFDEKYKIGELLYDHVNPLSIEQISKVVGGYLKQAGKFGKFNSYFTNDSKEVFKDYVSLTEPDVSKTEVEVSTKALNYLLDVLNVFSNVASDDEGVFYLSPTNQSISVATTDISKGKKDKSSQQTIFKKKLILRRALASLYYCFSSIPDFETKYQLDLKSKGYKFSYLCCLLREGYTHPVDRTIKARNNSIFLTPTQAKPSYNRIGFNIECLEDIHNLFNTSDSDKPFKDCLLDEETRWVKTVSSNIVRIRGALDEIYNCLISKVTLPDFGFSDLNHFNEWYKNSVNLENREVVFPILKGIVSERNVNIFFRKYFPIEIAHLGAGRLGLGLVTPIINQLGDKIVVINRFSHDWQNYKTRESITIDCNGIESTYRFYHQDLPDDKKREIRKVWEESCKMKLIVAVDYENIDEISFFIKDVQHITTSLKTGLKKAKQILEETNFHNLVTIYPFENNKQDVHNFYEDLNDDQFEKSLLIADRVCTHTELHPESNKILVYAEKYGNVVINGSRVRNNLFRNEPRIKGIDYIFCEDKEEFEFHFSKKFRILNCVHASLAVMCYDRVMDKIPKEKWGEQYVNLLNDGKIKSDIEKVAIAEIIKLIATTDKEVLNRVFPSKDIGEVYNELKVYSNTIFDRFDGMADRLDRVLNLRDLIDKFDGRIDDTINFFDGSNETTINIIVNEIHENDKPNIKEIDKTLRALLRKVSKINRKQNA